MKKDFNFKHISDVWKAFEECYTIDEIEEVIRWIPSVFGLFTYEQIKDVDEDGYITIRVTNDYYDETLEMNDFEAQDFYIQIGI